jgi:hypothetical protein
MTRRKRYRDRSRIARVWLVHPGGTDDHQIADDVETEQLLPLLLAAGGLDSMQ